MCAERNNRTNIIKVQYEPPSKSKKMKIKIKIYDKYFKRFLKYP